jgi:hypothetical protein
MEGYEENMGYEDAERVLPIDQIYDDADSSMNPDNLQWQQQQEQQADFQDNTQYGFVENEAGDYDEYASGEYAPGYGEASGEEVPFDDTEQGGELDYYENDADNGERIVEDISYGLDAQVRRMGSAGSVPEELDEDDENLVRDEYEADDNQQESVNGSSVHYSDDFVSKPNSMDQLLPNQLGIENDANDEVEEDEDDRQFVGVITVKLISGIDIAPISTLFEGKCDPYVVLSLGTQQVECQRVDNSVNPEWNERVLLSWDGFSVLHAQVNDYNEAPVQHEFLGEAYIDLEQLELEPDATKTLDVKLENAVSGSLRFELTLRAG